MFCLLCVRFFDAQVYALVTQGIFVIVTVIFQTTKNGEAFGVRWQGSRFPHNLRK
jgi:predicted ester cyclase